MDIEHRIGFIGIGAAAFALVATQTNLLPFSLAGLNPFGRSEITDAPTIDQQGRQLMFDREFDVRPGGHLSIEVADADVKVRTGTSNHATVRVLMSSSDHDWGRELFNSMHFDVELSGSELRVDAESPHTERSHGTGNRGGVGFTVEVTLPQEYNATISLLRRWRRRRNSMISWPLLWRLRWPSL